MDSKVTIMFRGQELPMGTTLRVAYMVQGQHNHTPYLQIFEGLGEMLLEDQIGILWASFRCANTRYVDDMKLTRNDFQNDILDNYNLGSMMELLKQVIDGIMGNDENTDNDTKDVEAVEGNSNSLE